MWRLVHQWSFLLFWLSFDCFTCFWPLVHCWYSLSRPVTIGTPMVLTVRQIHKACLMSYLPKVYCVLVKERDSATCTASNTTTAINFCCWWAVIDHSSDTCVQLHSWPAFIVRVCVSRQIDDDVWISRNDTTTAIDFCQWCALVIHSPDACIQLRSSDTWPAGSVSTLKQNGGDLPHEHVWLSWNCCLWYVVPVFVFIILAKIGPEVVNTQQHDCVSFACDYLVLMLFAYASDFCLVCCHRSFLSDLPSPAVSRRPGRCPEIPEILKVVLKCPESFSMCLFWWCPEIF